MEHLIPALAFVAIILAVQLIRTRRRQLVDPVFGILTRIGLAERWTGRGAMVVLDIDHMKRHNTEIGHSAVNARIAGALREVLREGEAVAGRGYEGDEIGILVPSLEVADHVIRRTRDALARRGMSATFAPVEAGESFDATFARGIALVLDQKRARDARITAPGALVTE